MNDGFLPLFHALGVPLIRLLAGMSCALYIASLLESLGWTDYLNKMARPLSRAAHLAPIASSAFALAFISPSAANATLSEKFLSGELSFRELMFANLLNGLPAYFAHLPTIFLLLWPVLGVAALWYAAITLSSAIFRTGLTVLMGRYFLPPQPAYSALAPQSPHKFDPGGAFANAWKRFCKRLPKLLLFTIPIYILMFICQKAGFFHILESWMAAHLEWLAFLKPQAMGIIAIQLLAEMGATIGAASGALSDGSLTSWDAMLALLVGNVIATPLRALRHQLPVYAGFYSAPIALKLVLANQALRAFSLSLMIAIFVWVGGATWSG